MLTRCGDEQMAASCSTRWRARVSMSATCGSRSAASDGAGLSDHPKPHRVSLLFYRDHCADMALESPTSIHAYATVHRC